ATWSPSSPRSPPTPGPSSAADTGPGRSAFGQAAATLARSAQSAGAQHQIVDMVSAGASVGTDPRPLLVDFDLPTIVQQRGDHRRPDIVGRVEAEISLVRLVGVHPGMVN